MEACQEKFFDENLADFDYEAETLGALLTIQDSQAFYNNSFVEYPRAEMMKRFPSSGKSNHEPRQY